MTLGQRIWLLRDARSWSLTELARRAGLSKSYLWRVEQDKANPSIDTVRSLASAFGTTVSDVLGEPLPPRLDVSEEALWAATYGASFARQVHDYVASGRGAPDDEAVDNMREEAETIAGMAIGRGP